MYEAFPVLGGVVLGLIMLKIDNPVVKKVVFAVLSVVLGALATFVIAGEEWWFLLIDIPVVMLFAVATVWALPRLRERMAQRQLAQRH